MERITKKYTVEKIEKEKVCDICGRIFNPHSESDDNDCDYSMSEIWMNMTKGGNHICSEITEDKWYHFDICYKCFINKFMIWMKESFNALPQTDRMD